MSTVLFAVAGGLVALLAVRSYHPVSPIAPEPQIRSQKATAQGISTSSKSTADYAVRKLRAPNLMPQQEALLAKLRSEEQSSLGEVAELRDLVARLQVELTNARAGKAALATTPETLVQPKEAGVQSPQETSNKPKSPAARTKFGRNGGTHRDIDYSGLHQSVRGLMLLARDQLTQGHSDRTFWVLDAAETKALNNNAAYRGKQNPTESRLVQRIENAREALRRGDHDEALNLINLALSGIQVAK